MRTTLRIMLSLVILILIAMGIGTIQKASGQESTYVGVAKCKLCHFKQHNIWNKSKHSKAFEVLKPKEQENSRCLNCHVTGYRDTQQVGAEMVGVQCEACHGPGSLFIKIHAKGDKEGARKASMIARPDPESCKTCHNEQSSTFKGFDYAKMWEEIKHPK